MGNSLITDVHEYLEGNAADVDRVTEAFTDAGGENSHLDELVFDVAGNYGSRAANLLDDPDEQDAAISEFEGEASDLNNSATRHQVAAILMGVGKEEGERLVMDAVPSNSPSPR